MLLPRSPSSDPPKPVWTRKRVKLWMMGAWSAGRRPWRGADRLVEASEVRSALDWPAMFLPTTDPRTPEAQQNLFDWIWSQTAGEGFSDLCRRRNWGRRASLNLITWALDQIVAGLKRDHKVAERARNVKGS